MRLTVARSARCLSARNGTLADLDRNATSAVSWRPRLFANLLATRVPQ
jgi:hypothetical protein